MTEDSGTHEWNKKMDALEANWRERLLESQSEYLGEYFSLYGCRFERAKEEYPSE